MITDKEVLKSIRTIIDYCREQGRTCKDGNCLFLRDFDGHKCPIGYPLRELERIDGKPL